MEIERSFVIQNELGLHARAATLFVQTANQFAAEVELERDGQRVNGKSIMGVLMLVAAKGTMVTIRAHGQDAEAAVAALGTLVNNKFDEPR